MRVLKVGLPSMPSNLLNNLERPSRALVVGATGGIGAAVTDLLAREDFEAVHAFSRKAQRRDRPGVHSSPIDIEHEPSIAAAAQAVQQGAPLRFVLVATGLLHGAGLQPEKTYRSLDPEFLARSFLVNAVGPALVAKHMLPLLPKSGKSIFAVISARVGSIEDNRLGGWYGYRASKAALNQLVRTLAIELRRQKPHAICVALHPGTVDTALSQPFQSGVESGKLFPAAYAAERLLTVLNGLAPADTGAFFAWDGQRIPF